MLWVAMKTFFSFGLLLVLCLGLSSCLYKEPVFTGGFQKTSDVTLAGVWMTESETGDPRERDFAVLAPVGEAYMLHYPVGRKGGAYFEAQPLLARGKQLLQVHQVVSFDDGLPKADTPTYTVVWLEKTGEGKMSARALNHEGSHTVSAAAAKKALEDQSVDWNKLFGDAQVFVRLNEK